MFSTIGLTVQVILVLQTLVAVFVAYLWAPGAYKQMLERNPKMLRGCTRDQREAHRQVKTSVLFVRNALARSWLTSDLLWFMLGQREHVSRLRVLTFVQAIVCMGLAQANGFSSQDAVGLGAVAGVAVFAVGALGVFSGKVSATAGDRRVLGLN